MSDTSDSGPQPILPRTVEVGDLERSCAALGFPEPNPAPEPNQIEVLPGRSVTLLHGTKNETQFVYLCVADLTAARRSIEADFGSAAWNPDTVGPDSDRLVGRLLQANRLVIDGVRCPVANRTNAVPCDVDCSPTRRFT